jgi:signal transduction histidine kinase/ActR/RegA family two-component response regulator
LTITSNKVRKINIINHAAVGECLQSADIKEPFANNAQAQKIRAQLDSSIAHEFIIVRLKGIWSRLFFALACAICLFAMGVKPFVIFIWLFVTIISQFIEIYFAKQALIDVINIKKRDTLFLCSQAAAIIYASISPFAWFMGDIWAKLCITWFVIGSMVVHIVSEHRVQKMRVRMMFPYIIMMPLLVSGEIFFNDSITNFQLIALFGFFLAGSVFFTLFLRKNFSSVKLIDDLYFERELARVQADDANRAKSAFVAAVSHDLRNPLHAILGSAELLRHKLKSAENVELLNTLIDAGKNMTCLLNEILDHSKMEKNKLFLEITTFSPEKLFIGIADLWEAPIIGKNLEFICDFHGQLPDALKGDTIRICQIVNNLISNAYKFTKIGWVCLKAHYENGNLFFEVQDSGIGISDQEKARLFIPFSQANSDISLTYGGTGLGLSNSAQLVKLMGGNIELDTKLNSGSIFRVSIPLEIGDVKDLPKETNKIIVPEAMETANLRVLAAEDNPANSLILKRFLEVIGANVELVANGAMAIERANNNEYDIIFLDVRMPHIDGLEACRRIRKTSRFNCDTPIILVSADAAFAQIQSGLAAGADFYLPKPIEGQRLYSLIATASQGRGSF